MPLVEIRLLRSPCIAKKPEYAMLFLLPKADNPYFLGMSTCINIESDSPQIHAIFEKYHRRRLLSSIEATPAGYRLFHAFLGKPENKHFHVDYVTEQDFRQKSKLKTSEPNAEFYEELSSVIGLQACVGFFGRYRLPVDLPPPQGLINGGRFKTGNGTVSISKIKGGYRLKGVPVWSLEWKLTGDEDEVTVELKGSLNSNNEVCIDPNLLLIAEEELAKSFAALVYPSR